MKNVLKAFATGTLVAVTVVIGYIAFMAPLLYLASNYKFHEMWPYAALWVTFVLSILFSFILYKKE